MLTTKNIIITLLVIIVPLSIGLASYYYFVAKPNLKTSSTPPPFPDFTGASLSRDSISQEPSIKQEADLKELVPIKAIGFGVDFDYKKDKFVIELYPPYEENKKKFISYMEEKGFNLISKELFLYVLK